MNLRDELRLRADDYAMQHQLMIVEELGFGVHGSVFIAENHAKPDIPVQQSAVKVNMRNITFGNATFTFVCKGAKSPKFGLAKFLDS